MWDQSLSPLRHLRISDFWIMLAKIAAAICKQWSISHPKCILKEICIPLMVKQKDTTAGPA
uniref:Putative ovule protein n=1 Tax=Solanum chacoense TaxID=4108 RepID=A0A0V0HI76_SOLCH